ncbi:DUF2798 domain-containing protein [Aliagarivorans taiwanensis]
MRWAQAYLVAWPIAFSFMLLFGKPIHRMAERLCSRTR